MLNIENQCLKERIMADEELIEEVLTPSEENIVIEESTPIKPPKKGRLSSDIKNKLKAIVAFIKIGAIGFGGGTAVIPVIEREAIVKNGLITPDEFKEELVLQGITPGALPLKIACGLGVKSSPLFSVGLVYATALVGVILAIIFTAVLSVASSGVLTQVEYIAVGISAFIAIVIMKFVIKVPKSSKADKFLKQALVLIFASMLLSCCSRIESILALFGVKTRLHIPELSVTSILVLGINFVLFTRFEYKKTIECALRYALAIPVTVIGILAFAKEPIIDHIAADIVLYVVIAAMLSSVIIQDFLKAKKLKKMSTHVESHDSAGKKVFQKIRIPLMTIGFLLIPMIVFGLVVGLVNATGFTHFISLTGKSILAVVTTFGGGTAFISIAEGVFVEGGIVSNELFWSQIVPIANALPGPLLCKMLATVWYHAAFSLGTGVGISILYSIYGAILGTTVTVVVYLLIYMLFQYLKELSIFEKLKLSILPLIAGLLIPTVLSMIINMVSVTMTTGINVWYGMLFTAVTIALCYIPIRFKVKEPIVIVGIGGLSCGALNLIAYLV